MLLYYGRHILAGSFLTISNFSVPMKKLTNFYILDHFSVYFGLNYVFANFGGSLRFWKLKAAFTHQANVGQLVYKL